MKDDRLEGLFCLRDPILASSEEFKSNCDGRQNALHTQTTNRQKKCDGSKMVWHCTRASYTFNFILQIFSISMPHSI